MAHFPHPANHTFCLDLSVFCAPKCCSLLFCLGYLPTGHVLMEQGSHRPSFLPCAGWCLTQDALPVNTAWASMTLEPETFSYSLLGQIRKNCPLAITILYNPSPNTLCPKISQCHWDYLLDVCQWANRSPWLFSLPYKLRRLDSARIANMLLYFLHGFPINGT